MLPEFVTVKVTAPGAAVDALSSIEYSLSVAVMADPDGGVGDAPLQAVASITSPTSPARAVCGLLMLSPSSSLCTRERLPAA
jgi:hypothetical protein